MKVQFSRLPETKKELANSNTDPDRCAFVIRLHFGVSRMDWEPRGNSKSASLRKQVVRRGRRKTYDRTD